jgi:hypothetical protein
MSWPNSFKSSTTFCGNPSEIKKIKKTFYTDFLLIKQLPVNTGKVLTSLGIFNFDHLDTCDDKTLIFFNLIIVISGR